MTSNYTGGPVGGYSDDLDYAEPDDFGLIVDYLGGDLPRAEMRAVKKRLASDPAFLELAMPLIMIRHSPLGPDAELEFRSPPLPAATATVATTVVTDAPVITLGKRNRLGFHLTPPVFVAAAMVTVSVVTLLLVFNKELQWDVTVGRAAAARVAMLTTASQARTVALVNGARIILRPHGAITYDQHAPPSGFRHLTFWGPPAPRYALTLNGSAALAVPADVGAMDVVTTAGLITLEPDGVYELSSSQEPARGRVNVLRGRATLVPNDPAAASLTLASGEAGQLDDEHGAVRLTGLTIPASGAYP